MSTGNITKFLNGTSFNDEKNGTVRLSFFQTTLLILFVVTTIILLSSLAYYLAKKRAMNKMKHHLVPLYHFDPGECDNWEDELLEDSIKGKPRVGHQVSVVLLYILEQEISRVNVVAFNIACMSLINGLVCQRNKKKLKKARMRKPGLV